MRIIAADIGGTKTLLQLAEFTAGQCRVLAEKRYASPQYASFTALLQQFISDTQPEQGAGIDAGCFGVAGPVQVQSDGQTAQATKLPWSLDSRQIAGDYNIPRVRLINDFQAIGYGIEGLTEGYLVTLQPGQAEPHAPRAIIGAGTGLGTGWLVWQGDHYESIPSEGGHVDFAPVDNLQMDLLRSLMNRHGHVSYDRLLSGSGLVAIYQYLRQLGLVTESPMLVSAMLTGDPAAAITEAALQGGDLLASQALDLFVSIYGAQAGNLALTCLARGGVYVAGGIAPKILPRLQEGGFIRAFNSKGRMGELTRQMPVRVITNTRVGLVGAALAACRL